MHRLAAPCLLAAAITLGACNSSRGDERAAAVHAVTTWAPKGIKGEVVFDKVECAPQSAGKYRCRGDARGGGHVWMSATLRGNSFEIALAEQIVVASRLETMIADHLDKMGLGVLVKCGDRVRPSTPGSNFKCSIENAKGEVLNAADVTIKDDKGNLDWKLVTAPVASEKVEAKIREWLSGHNIAGAPNCGPRHHFSRPGVIIMCDIEGESRQVKVTMNDFRGNMTLDLVDGPTDG